MANAAVVSVGHMQTILSEFSLHSPLCLAKLQPPFGINNFSNLAFVFSAGISLGHVSSRLRNPRAPLLLASKPRA